ncbi:lysophosphatidic acid acyltransferase LOA1 KNAG_0A07860 [Huiozyma naganishii CBS 8797]|uniref:Phospholipid/glycerol acyltransferase domain-containing protein n=1 Tax=Huiozyma naganishii (strain ATCC MYA-139 / BCRC 22969 / CBS 8797 / KCTC 17520 / NBRC 10181 / NCYC 3082 / Yp74L-3) TaxID=1071383 RepID=J7RFX0_HUIN7|nr:hypothetical protein KNAG_0A07860 [Kazachstania naganishii CBS 8797]CCK68438.1 hypothetical protein KNAG_0A07860 [Kazachstania naganishii CBS 8797]
MEKYTNYRDKGTGIGPFFPVPSRRASTVTKIGLWTVFLVKLVLTLPLLVAAILIPMIRPRVLRWTTSFLFGMQLDVRADGVRRSDLSRFPWPRAGDDKIYVVNWTSALDSLVCSLLSGGGTPQFLVPDTQPGAPSAWRVLTAWEFFRLTCAGSLHARRFGRAWPGHVAQQQQQQQPQQRGPLFAFPEGTCSNGKTVLPFAGSLHELLSPAGQPGGEPGSPAALVPLRVSFPRAATTPLQVSLRALAPGCCCWAPPREGALPGGLRRRHGRPERHPARRSERRRPLHARRRRSGRRGEDSLLRRVQRRPVMHLPGGPGLSLANHRQDRYRCGRLPNRAPACVPARAIAISARSGRKKKRALGLPRPAGSLRRRLRRAHICAVDSPSAGDPECSCTRCGSRGSHGILRWLLSTTSVYVEFLYLYVGAVSPLILSREIPRYSSLFCAFPVGYGLRLDGDVR